MMIQITEKTEIDNCTYYTFETEKKTIDISYDAGFKTVRVLVKNASHRAYRGSFGRVFDTFEAAIEAYKSADVKEVIRTVQAEQA